MEKLIINKRHEMPRRKRWLWDAMTIALWLGFIYLWKPVLIIGYKILTLEVPSHEVSYWIFETISSVTFGHAIYTLIGTPLVLFILSRLNRHRAPSEHLLYKADDYADYFHINPTQLQTCVDSQLVSVYHDDHGQITTITNRID